MTNTAPPHIERPPFLVGAERSGTTVLRLMLDHHPQVSWVNEFEYAVDRMVSDDGWPNVHEYHEWLETHRVFRASGFEIDRSLAYADLVRAFLLQGKQRSGKPIVGATCHRHFDRLPRIWPDARFIHICRDPRDVARSSIGMGWAGNVYTGVQDWIEAERLWEDLAASVGPARCHEVKQEDLIRQPQRELTRICEFVAVEYDPAMLSYPADTTYAAPDPSLVEQWRRKASEQETRLVEARVGDLLARRGYEPSGLPPLETTPTAVRRLLRQDRWARRQARLRRYGFWLWIANALARRLGPRAWRRHVGFRINEIDTKYLK